MLLALGCAPQASSTATSTPSTGSTNASQSAADCAQGKTKTDGSLTVATDSPAYDPWFRHNDPSNGKGYESAVAYAVAKQLGFTPSSVTWVKEPFNNSYAPGPKNFDFDINQISITPDRAQKVTFSDGYYTAAQALIALKDSPVAKATSLADLKKFKLGAQTGTTSLTAIRNDIQPDAAAAGLPEHERRQAGAAQPPGRRASSPTCRRPSTSPPSQIPQSTIVGQFQQQSGSPEQFGMLFEKDNPLCRLCQPGAGHDQVRRHPGRDRAEVAEPDRERPRPQVTGP